MDAMMCALDTMRKQHSEQIDAVRGELAQQLDAVRGGLTSDGQQMLSQRMDRMRQALGESLPNPTPTFSSSSKGKKAEAFRLI